MEVFDIGIGKIGVADSLQDLPPSGVDALLVAEPFLREVRLAGEIAGLTAFAASVAALSEQCDYPILCGCRTVFQNVRHISVLTFAGGRLADIADRTASLSGGYAEGDSLKVFRLKNFRLGLLVDTDVLFADNWKRIAPQCDAVACVALRPSDPDFGYIPTLSSLYGIPYAAAFSGGEILWGTP
ncbi:MAG: hypothetical protein K2L51_03405 [Clostridiales bacterium]|nr:hypothetical protein [Clostridiales bacterium]